MEHEESFGPHTVPDEDLSASLVSSQIVLPPPTTSPATLPQGRFNRVRLGAVQTLLGSSTAPGTVRTYEAALRSLTNFGAPVLFMSDEATFIAFFGATLLLGPKSATLSTGQPCEVELRRAGERRGGLLARRPWIPGSV